MTADLERLVGPLGELHGPLRDGGYFREVTDGQMTVDDLALKIRGWRADKLSRSVGAVDKRVKSVEEQAAADWDRRWALASVVVAFARKDWEVAAFRADVLRGQLLDDAAAAETWIRQRAAEEGRSLYSEVAFDDEDIRYQADGSPYIEGRFKVSSGTKWLHFVDPTEDQVPSVPVRNGGVLDRLRRLSEDLAADFHWQDAQATVFLLTDMVPLLPTLRVGSKAAGFRRLDRDDNGSSRCGPTLITMEVDPDVSPADVEAAYRRQRLQVLKAKKPQPLASKGARLVAYVAARHDWSWPERWRSWNRDHPDDAYPDHRAFRNAATRAEDRVMRSW